MTTAANYERAGRWRKTAETWAKKATAVITHEAGSATNEYVQAALGWEAASLIATFVDEGATLAPYVSDDLIEDVERSARELVAALRAQRLAGKLEQTDGRTPEETAAFKAKAAELRSR